MQLTLTGINHHTAPVAIREKAAINTERLPNALNNMKDYLYPGVILSTCNRTEIYSTGRLSSNGNNPAVKFFEERLGIDEDYRKYIYHYQGREAAKHLFRVAGGLESMVVGEYEVLGQAGKALESAERAGTLDLALRQTFQSAIKAGRRIREETEISRSPVSISSIALDLAAKTTGDLKERALLVIGTGEAGQLVAKVARERGVPRIVISSKKPERAAAVAGGLGGIPLEVHRLSDELLTADIVVTCSSAPHWVLDVNRFEETLKRRTKPLVIIDIAVPRNVQPEVAALEKVFLYNIDHLKEISGQNLKQREKDIQGAEKIIEEELEDFAQKWQSLEIAPIISALMSKAEEIRATQLKKTLKKLPQLSAEQQANLDSMTKSIVTRILQEPIDHIRANGDEDRYRLVRELFNLDEGK
jgi:glutamyl-tRNA reductase